MLQNPKHNLQIDGKKYSTLLTNIEFPCFFLPPTKNLDM